MGFAYENLPPLPSGGRVEERVALVLYAVYLQAYPHPNLPPLDGGRDKVAATERGRLKNLFGGFSDDLVAFRYSKSIIASIRY